MGTMITLNDLSNKREQYGKEEPLFISRYLYSRAHPYTGKVLSNFYADFDNAEDPQRALVEGLDMAEQFKSMGVKEKHIKLRFTGNKGCSVEVPYQYFGAGPRADLPQIWKRIAEWFVGNWHYKTLDMSVYGRTRMWRLINTRHFKSSLFKIRVSIQELKDNKLEGIKELAKNNRTFTLIDDRAVEVNPITKLVGLYKDIRKDVSATKRRWKKRVKERIVFDGKLFPCVERLIKEGINAEEFQRNPTAFNIAVSLVEMDIDEEQILEYLEEFAGNCTPAFPLERYPELVHCIDSAKKHEYSTHCGTPCFEAACIGKRKCWVFTKGEEEGAKDKPKKEAFDEETYGKADELLNDPNIIEFIVHAVSDVIKERNLTISAIVVIIGEDSIMIGGPSSTGKNKVADTAVECFPEHWVEEVTGLSDKVLRYLKRDIRILYLKEAKAAKGKGMDQESTAEFDLKMSMSEGMLEVWVTVKDKKTGEFRAQKIKTRITSVIQTTTDASIPEQLQNRMLEGSTNPSINIPVVSFMVEQRELPKSMRLNLKPMRKIIRCAIEKLDAEAPKDFIIPYATALLEDIIIHFGNNPRVRRDWQKLERMIYAYAKLNYRSRPILKDPECGDHLICLPIDFYYAMLYSREVILGTLIGRTEHAQHRLDQIMEILQDGRRLDSTTLATYAGIHQTSARDWLERYTNEGELVKGKRDRYGTPYSSVRVLTQGDERSSSITISLLKLRSISKGWSNRPAIKEFEIGRKDLLDEPFLSEEMKENKIFLTLPPSLERSNLEGLPKAVGYGDDIFRQLAMRAEDLMLPKSLRGGEI